MLAIKTDANFKQLPGHHPAHKLLNVCDQLSIAKLGETDVIMLDGRRIVVPKEQGETEELREAIDACQNCQEDRLKA